MSENRRRILIVDDDTQLLSAMKNLFRKTDIDILMATNGAEALEMIEKESFSLVISDVRMPKMSGVQLLEALNSRGIDVPVIILSGHSDYNDADIDERDGVVLLSKTSSPSELRSIVVEYLSLLPDKPGNRLG